MTRVGVSPRGSAGREARSRKVRGRRFAARRLAFFLIFLGVVIVVSVAANYGPLRHYVDARGRLEEATVQVEALEQRTSALQARIGKLSQSGYLEDLAREQLSYARPGEDLFIVAKDSSGAAIAGRSATAADADGGGATDGPGLFERLLSGIAGIF